jgi:S1-C subfamily serine protease
LVLGHSYGAPGSVSLGSVAGCGRPVIVEGRKVENLLQLHAAAQPGDGGALVADSAGRLLGMLHSAASGEPAMAYAVPVDWVRFSAERIIRHGRMVRGWIGASLMKPGETVREALRLGPGHGAEVARVERGSPARRAGLEAGDVLLEFDGAPVGDLEALQWRVVRYETPGRVRIAFVRERERREADLAVELEPQE